jgi:oligopeptide transport system substrate-binding protein
MPGIRRHTPQIIITSLLIAAVIGGALAFNIGFASNSTSKQPTAVLHWANEGISDLYTLDPAKGPDFNARQAMQLIYTGLVRFGPHFRIMPDAAQSWTIDQKGRRYTFHLRPGVRFADGSPLTASDVAVSLNRVFDPLNHGSSLLDVIQGATAVEQGHGETASGIRVLNRRTISITLSHADGSFLAKLANPDGYIVPAKAVSSNLRRWSERPFGAGPFMVSRWVHNYSLLLVPNPYYYGGPLHISGIDMPFIPELLTAYKQYRAGTIDTMGAVHFPVEALYDVRGRTDFHPSARLETVFLTLNERLPPFDDTRIRLAFARALDKAALVRQVWANFAHPTDEMMPPGLPGYDPSLRGAHFNPALARRLLAAAGYPGGRSFPTITYPVDQDAQSVVLANALAAQWHRVLGVRVRPVQYTHSTYLSLLTNLEFRIAVIDWTDDYPDPENFLSQQLHTGNANNNGGWSNATFDHLVDRADSLPSGDPARFTLYRRAQQIAMSQAATIPLANPNAGILLRSSVHGITISGGYLLVADWSNVRIAGSGQR